MRYVVGFLRDTSDRVLLVRKRRPMWQAGRLNGIGGKIEFAELPLAAMIREWIEEVGYALDDWRPFCVLTGGEYEVHFFCAFLPMRHEAALERHANDVGEAFEVVALDGIRQRGDMIPNLKWLLPLAFDDHPSLPFATVADCGIVTGPHSSNQGEAS